MAKFILNDSQKQNSYGFCILTQGIDLTRFLSNPVMLDGHSHENAAVIGRWLHIKKENGLLVAQADFDPNDPNAQLIAGKVERGFIKGASMGISFAKKDLRPDPDGNLVLHRCEIFEASIVAVPSNPNAILLKMDGAFLTHPQAQELCLQLTNEYQTHKKEKEMKIYVTQPTSVALGITPQKEGISAQELEQAVLTLEKEKNDIQTQLKIAQEKVLEFTQKEAQMLEAQAQELVENAIKEGKITADKKSDFKQLALQNFALVKNIFQGIAPKRDFSAGNKTPNTTETITTMEDFQKLGLEEQLAFKNANPEAYQKLVS